MPAILNRYSMSTVPRFLQLELYDPLKDTQEPLEVLQEHQE